MPKSILEFNLPEENEEFQRTIKATDLCSCLWDFDQYLRQIIKYGNKKNNPTLEQVREKFYELMDENGIKLEELYS